MNAEIPSQTSFDPLGPVVYDFKHPDRITKDQLRTLRGLHEKFAQTFATSLSTLLRTMIQIDLEDVEQIAYADYMMSLPNPNCLYILGFDQMKGNALMSVDPSLTMFVIDRLLGGGGEGYTEMRPITLIEQSVLKQVVERILVQLNETWRSICDLQTRIMNFESNPLFVQISPASEIVIVLRFKIQSGELDTNIDFCFPYFVLEEILPALSAQRWQISTKTPEEPHDRPELDRQLKRVNIPLVVTIDAFDLLVHEIAQLQVGDILRLDRHEDDALDVKIDNQVKYKCRPGTIGRKMAIQITEVIDSKEDLLSE